MPNHSNNAFISRKPIGNSLTTFGVASLILRVDFDSKLGITDGDNRAIHYRQFDAAYNVDAQRSNSLTAQPGSDDSDRASGSITTSPSAPGQMGSLRFTKINIKNKTDNLRTTDFDMGSSSKFGNVEWVLGSRADCNRIMSSTNKSYVVILHKSPCASTIEWHLRDQASDGPCMDMTISCSIKGTNCRMRSYVGCVPVLTSRFDR
jgi:hypothetical protein